MGVACRIKRMLLALVVGTALLVVAVAVGACGSQDDEDTSTTVASTVTSTSEGAAITEQQVIDLVALTCGEMEKDVAATLTAIDAGDQPFVDPANPELYAFVYDMEVKLISTPDVKMRGQNLKGKPDAVGKLFRDEIVSGALAGGSGWVQYVYEEPGKAGLFQKATYYQLVTGSDGEKYVVCAGRYLGPYDGAAQGDVATVDQSPTAAEVQTFVKKAVAYAEEHGKSAALEAFTQEGGEFHQGQLYIYAYDFTGTVIAHGGDAGLVGQNLLDMRDPNGVPVIQNLVRLASEGGGWLYYTWPNPANGNQQEPKLGYVLKVDDEWFLGSGTYGPAASEPPSKDEVVAFVDEACAYAQAHGRDAAIAEFMNRASSFFSGELYIFAYDMEGRVLCLPPEPEKIGDDRWDIQDQNGVHFVQEFVETVTESGSGWVEYVYLNPAQQNQVQKKIAYVRKVDDTWLIGSGTYLPE